MIEFPGICVVELFHEFALPLYDAHHLVIVHLLGKLEVDFLVFPEHIHNVLYPLFDNLTHRPGIVELGFLLEIAYLIAAIEIDAALVILV